MKYLTLFLIHYSLFTIHHSAAAPADEQRVTKGNASAPEQGDRRGASKRKRSSTPQNFIIIFTDDQGYQDLGCFGSEDIKTPHIDRMASEGRMLTSFYSANPVCSASRAALMTGCYPRRVLETKTVLFPGDNVGLHPEETTIADMLKTKGYATACVGKWHLGHHPEFLPTSQGFDSYFGIPYSNDMSHPADAKRPRYGKWDEYWSKPKESGAWKTPLIENEKILEHPVDQRNITRRYTDRAISFIRSPTKRNPFSSTSPTACRTCRSTYRTSSTIRIPSVPTSPSSSTSMPRSAASSTPCARRVWTKNTYVIFTSDNGPWLRFGHHAGKARATTQRQGQHF